MFEEPRPTLYIPQVLDDSHFRGLILYFVNYIRLTLLPRYFNLTTCNSALYITVFQPIATVMLSRTAFPGGLINLPFIYKRTPLTITIRLLWHTVFDGSQSCSPCSKTLLLSAAPMHGNQLLDSSRTLHPIRRCRTALSTFLDETNQLLRPSYRCAYA